MKWGTGALNIDGSRISVAETDSNHRKPSIDFKKSGDSIYEGHLGCGRPTENLNSQGRWPANVLLDEEAAQALDEQSGTLKSGSLAPGHKRGVGSGNSLISSGGIIQKQYGNDSGGASRFFYVAKASKRERNAGLEGEVKSKQGSRPNSKDASGKFPDHDHRESGGNNHPTVKPIKLMEYLIKLVTPPNGTCLDPFMGSGSTGVAAKSLGFSFVGIERELEYFEIATCRLGAA